MYVIEPIYVSIPSQAAAMMYISGNSQVLHPLCKNHSLDCFTSPLSHSLYLSWYSYLAIVGTGFLKEKSGQNRHTCPGNTIDTLLKSEIDSKITFWRDVLLRIINVIITLVSCNLPLRGHDSDSGNFMTISRLLSNYDATLKDLLLKPKGEINYLSPTIQNEIISLLGTTVRNNIISEIKKAPFLTIILDTTQDLSKIDQLSVVFRYISVTENDDNSFLGFIAVTDCSDAGLKTVILNLTKEYEIDLTKCRGQGYDGANVMSGVYGGLQTLIKEHAPNTDYVHCAVHALNLVLNDAARHVCEVSTFFDNLEKIYTFFGNSIKRRAMLSDDSSEKYLIIFKKVCPTRWPSGNDALLAVKKNFLLIMKTLYQLNLISNKKDEREECKSIIKILDSFDFLVLVTFFSYLFEIINPVSIALQHENNDLQKSSILLSNLLNRLCQLRNQNSFNSLLNKSKDLAKEWGVTTVFKNSRRKITNRFFDNLSQDERISDPESYFKVNVYYCCLDVLISQTKEIFQSLSNLSSVFEILQPEKLLSSSSEEILSASVKLSAKYSKDISLNLCDQLKALKTCLNSEIKKIYSIKELIELLLVKFNSLASSFPEVITACLLFLTPPVTTATAESSFSKLKLIKNYLRTSMGQERLSDISLLSIAAETLEKLKSSSAINDLINQFAEKKARRVNI
nr:unnamed protein product [Callosobruchus analis]